MRIVLFITVPLLLPGLVVAGERVDFVRDVKPILARHCVACHGPQKHRSGLRLDSGASILKGGSSGPAVVAHKSKVSRLLQAVTGTGRDEVKLMPPKGPRLGAAEIAVLRKWIDAGAAVPQSEMVETTGPRSKHWAFQPVVRPPLPALRHRDGARTPIDHFILARLEKEGIDPAPEADRVTLLRRVSLDLTGLPPTPAEIERFLADRAPDAYEKQVDRLLASPHYGERWGRHWLDLARYADSNGYSIDSPRSIWKYRDWVIDALNRDLPFDRFVIEQLAGDLLPGATLSQKIATGFHRNTQINEEGGIDQEQFRVEANVDRTNTTGSVFLGLTVGCCQCHDHKFDPLAQREYYQLFAFFNSTDDVSMTLASPEQVKKRKETAARLAAVEKELKALENATPARVEKWEGSLTPASRAMLPRDVQHILTIAPNGRNPRQEAAVLTAYRRFDQIRHVVGGIADPSNLLPAAHLHLFAARLEREKQIDALKRLLPTITTTLVLSERKKPRVTTVMLGGDFLRKGAVVQPGTPAVLPPLPQGKATRLDLARWLVDGNNPLTARVAVNRYWQQFFGLGLVETENDFGTQGTLPSHPELLDFLASEFAHGWSVKGLHRLIVTSAVYRQSSRHRPELVGRDARNRLLARQNRLRLDAEVVRDAALSCSGLLNPEVGGPSVFPPQPQGVYAFTQIPRTWQADRGPGRYRRGLYTFFWRSAPHPDLVVFDAPDAVLACTRRNRSNTPLQALTLLNDEGFFECAQSLAARLLTSPEAARTGDSERIDRAFRLCLARAPRERERALLLHLLTEQRASFAQAPAEARQLVPAGLPKEVDAPTFAAWTAVARVLLNLDEFITRE